MRSSFQPTLCLLDTFIEYFHGFFERFFRPQIDRVYAMGGRTVDSHLMAVVNDQLYNQEHYVILEEFNQVFYTLYRTLRKQQNRYDTNVLLLRLQ